jgi:hypothetical protein
MQRVKLIITHQTTRPAKKSLSISRKMIRKSNKKFIFATKGKSLFDTFLDVIKGGYDDGEGEKRT